MASQVGSDSQTVNRDDTLQSFKELILWNVQKILCNATVVEDQSFLGFDNDCEWLLPTSYNITFQYSTHTSYA